METVGDLLDFIAPGAISRSTVDWPADAFACAASLLERSGAYLSVLTDWPPTNYRAGRGWAGAVRAIAGRWRVAAAAGRHAPRQIRDAWRHVLAARSMAVEALASNSGPAPAVREALLLILAAADEACTGVGIPGGKLDPFHQQHVSILQKTYGRGSTLCRAIPATKLSVLPKLHTPRTGITIRSLSHNLALCPASEVRPNWVWGDHPQLAEDRHGLNILVVPWPLEIAPTAFSSAIPRQGCLANMDDGFGFFEYQVRGGDPLDIDALKQLLEKCRAKIGVVDMIVFPELALTAADIGPLAMLIKSLDPQPILIGGVCVPATGAHNMCRNTSITIVPLRGGKSVFALGQDKHHRWLLDGRQVKQYGLGGVLDPTIDWWEHSAVSRRELGFISLQPWLTLCTLICEDLARPDPIANMVRAVGPNLVVALLMDGPQIANRWSARYGTVLADDPGSSVLTVSPLGMVKLSRPRGMPASNVVALWKDAESGTPTEIGLPAGHQAVFLSLTRQWRKEFSADGRDDDGATSYLTLSGIHPV